MYVLQMGSWEQKNKIIFNLTLLLMGTRGQCPLTHLCCGTGKPLALMACKVAAKILAQLAEIFCSDLTSHKGKWHAGSKIHK